MADWLVVLKNTIKVHFLRRCRRAGNWNVSPKSTKPVAQREGADSRAHFGPLDLETGWSNPGKKRFW